MVIVPLYDDNHLKFIPFQATTWILIAINFAVFIWQQTFTPEALDLLYQPLKVMTRGPRCVARLRRCALGYR